MDKHHNDDAGSATAHSADSSAATSRREQRRCDGTNTPRLKSGTSGKRGASASVGLTLQLADATAKAAGADDAAKAAVAQTRDVEAQLVRATQQVDDLNRRLQVVGPADSGYLVNYEWYEPVSRWLWWIKWILAVGLAVLTTWYVLDISYVVIIVKSAYSCPAGEVCCFNSTIEFLPFRCTRWYATRMAILEATDDKFFSNEFLRRSISIMIYSNVYHWLVGYFLFWKTKHFRFHVERPIHVDQQQLVSHRACKAEVQPDMWLIQLTVLGHKHWYWSGPEGRLKTVYLQIETHMLAAAMAKAAAHMEPSFSSVLGYCQREGAMRLGSTPLLVLTPTEFNDGRAIALPVADSTAILAFTYYMFALNQDPADVHRVLCEYLSYSGQRVFRLGG